MWVSISLSLNVHDIGGLLDCHLDMSVQVSNICRAAYSILYCQNTNKSDNCSMKDSRPRPRHITARLPYGNAVLYGISNHLLHCLEKVQHSATRVVLCVRRGDQRIMTGTLQQLHWLPMKYCFEHKLLVNVFRALHD